MTAHDGHLTLYAGHGLGDYHFGHDHPFGCARHDAFLRRLRESGLDTRCLPGQPRLADRAEIERFHSPDYVTWVAQASARGTGYLDGGDTPARQGIFEAASRVVGTVVQAVADIMQAKPRARRAFVPIAGLHHARRNGAAGFCVFNDCGVAIETLRGVYGLRRVAYVDIDAHHGDGVFYAFQSDADCFIADIHQDGRTLYPGTGSADEDGTGAARGTKLNLPLPPGAGDREFRAAWDRVEQFVGDAAPEFILFQCGADSLAGDPITQLAYTSAAHGHAAARLCDLAERHCDGRLLALGGGGYNLANLAEAWCAVVGAMVTQASG